MQSSPRREGFGLNSEELMRAARPGARLPARWRSDRYSQSC